MWIIDSKKKYLQLWLMLNKAVTCTVQWVAMTIFPSAIENLGIRFCFFFVFLNKKADLSVILV